MRATLPVIPSNSQLLDTTALPFGLIVQPFAPLRYDENPVPLVSNFTTGSSAFDPPNFGDGEEGGPPRCERCRGYINPWVRWTDGGRKWGCSLCGTSNIGKLLHAADEPELTTVPESYFCHLAPTGQRMDHESRPEMQNGTVDFLVPRIYWAPQPPPSGSLIDSAIDNTTDAISSTASDLLSGLQSSLGQDKSRAPTPQPNAREREKERKKEEKRLRKPQGLGRVFVIDVSSGSVQRGILSEICEGIRRAVYGDKPRGSQDETENDDDVDEEDVGLGRGERIAIMTVAETVGFWNLSVSISGERARSS